MLLRVRNVRHSRTFVRLRFENNRSMHISRTYRKRGEYESAGSLQNYTLPPMSFYCKQQQRVMRTHQQNLFKGKRGEDNDIISPPVALAALFSFISLGFTSSETPRAYASTGLEVSRTLKATLVSLCPQASFLQTDLPLHVALTKHKACRTTSSKGMAATGASPGRPPQEHPGVGHEEDGGVKIMERDDQPVSGASNKRGELVGTAEVDWR